jgi:TonB-dependent SusC/RagA subfamily outer membrane receptor
MRGTGSFYGSTEPLIVIDGIPLAAGHGGRLAGINPYYIESIEVLRHPPGTTQYGVRGANGVILIKTKRPGR